MSWNNFANVERQSEEEKRAAKAQLEAENAKTEANVASSRGSSIKALSNDQDVHDICVASSSERHTKASKLSTIDQPDEKHLQSFTFNRSKASPKESTD